MPDSNAEPLQNTKGPWVRIAAYISYLCPAEKKSLVRYRIVWYRLEGWCQRFVQIFGSCANYEAVRLKKMDTVRLQRDYQNSFQNDVELFIKLTRRSSLF
jgi:hypothetical protein